MDNKPLMLSDLVSFIGDEVLHVYGDTSKVFIKYLKPQLEVDEYTLDWISQGKVNKQDIAESSKARVILADQSVIYSAKMASEKKVLITVSSPRSEISKIGNAFFVKKTIPFVHSSAIIDKEASVGLGVYIGPHTHVGSCKIGDNCIIEDNVTINDNVVIGNNVIIHSGAVIGTEGLGCSRGDSGELVKFPHLGGLVIQDNVEIGANCSVAKGSFGNTIIGRGSKINSLCFIAHNCILGENVLITGCSMLNGSVVVGRNCTIYSNVIIRDQRCIGEGATIGMGSVVTKDVPDGELWIGNPARPLVK